MEIRPYSESDEAAVAALWRKVFPGSPAWNHPETDIQRKLSVQRELFLVALADGELVGTAMGGYDGHRGWVYYVAVSRRYRRRGIGTALMQRVEEELLRLGCPKINLQVRASNQEVVAFYEQLGYEVEERVSMGKRLMEPDESLNLLTRFHLEPQTGIAFTVRQGQIIRIIDVEGEQVSDLVCFAQQDMEEYLSSGHTIDYNGKIHLSKDDVLYSNRSNPMLTILTDRVGKHNFLYVPCSQEMFRLTYGVTEAHPNCLDNLVANLEPFGVKASQISTAFNVFMNIVLSEAGEITIQPPLSRAGDCIDLRAEMDLVVGVTACSAGACNNYRCTSIDVEIYAEGPES